MGSDTQNEFLDALVNNFNPRCPCGQRHGKYLSLSGGSIFQSTLPVWAATLTFGKNSKVYNISIHAARVGSDLTKMTTGANALISIHAARVGSDYNLSKQIKDFDNFNPRCPCGQRLKK